MRLAEAAQRRKRTRLFTRRTTESRGHGGSPRSLLRVSVLRVLPMKTEFTDVSDTQKTLTIEIPSDIVDAEINRVAKGYSREARLPGFRPGKVPATVIKQRFRDQILHDVMHGLIASAVDEAPEER